MQGTKPQFKTAGLLFRMFRVNRIQDKGTMQGVQVQQVTGELRTKLGMQIQVKQDRLNVTTATENEVALDEEQLLFIAGGQDNTVDKDVDEQPVQYLTLTMDNVFQANDCDAFDSDVDEAPTAQTMFMANLSSANLIYDKAGLSYDSDILSENDVCRLVNLSQDLGTIGWKNSLAEWDWEVKMMFEAVKLNRGLKQSNYDQLYAYLKQHEAHANENKMMFERFTQHMVNPIALMSNVSHQLYSSQSSTTPPSIHVPPVTYYPYFADNIQLNLGPSLTDNLIENLTNTLSLLT
ncbi:hypothetical protein Tco_0086124 [Tanacetum coccineum]